MDNKYEITAENLTVVFNNVFNKETIRGLEPREYNLLMGIVGKIKKKGIEEVTISFDEVSSLIGNEYETASKIITLVDSLWEKVKMTDYALYVQGKNGPKKAGGVMLFSYLSVDEKEHQLKIMMNPALEYFVNSFTQGGYTSLRLKDFQRATNKYGKSLFKLLAQYSTTGFYKVQRDDLIRLLDKPDSYDIRRFHSRVLNPAIKDVSEFFVDLELTKVKKGRNITHYEFRFKPQKNTRKWDPSLGTKTRKDVTPDKESGVDELQKELYDMWVEQELELPGSSKQ